jgi:hypothetical protein
MCVDCCCNAMFEDVVDLAVDTKMTAEAYFDDQDKNIKTAAKIIRPGGICLTIMGIYLLFSPIIALLTWIPLVGSLLGFAVSVAAFIFALIVGLVISCLVIAIAWVFYRPLIGVSLLVLVAIGMYFIFIFPSGEAAVTDEGVATNSDANASDSTATTPTTNADGSVTTAA